MCIATILQRLRNGNVSQGEKLKSVEGVTFQVSDDGRNLIVSYRGKKLKGPLLIQLRKRPGDSIRS